MANASDGSAPAGRARKPGWWVLSHWKQPEHPVRRLNLALQGGGAHGAYTWGVLDGLLADANLHLEGLSGSSAGAINAVVLAHGWAVGGRDGARQALADFWTELGRQGPSGGVSVGQGDSFSLSPASKFLANWAGHFSPALFNPQDVNPLRDLLEQQVDFERLRQHSPFKLFVGATHANSGKLRVFREHELTLDALMASACLPRLSRTVTIDGQPYWDGGYAANPPVTPLLLECSVGDVMLVLLDPLEYPGVPQQVADIDLRLIDLAFATNLRREMQWLDQARSLLGEASASGGWLERRLRHAHFHQIDTQHLPQLHKSETKLLVHGPFLQQLMRHGQEAAQTWLQQHGQDLGKRSSMDWTTWR